MKTLIKMLLIGSLLIPTLAFSEPGSHKSSNTPISSEKFDELNEKYIDGYGGIHCDEPMVFSGTYQMFFNPGYDSRDVTGIDIAVPLSE